MRTNPLQMVALQPEGVVSGLLSKVLQEPPPAADGSRNILQHHDVTAQGLQQQLGATSFKSERKGFRAPHKPARCHHSATITTLIMKGASASGATPPPSPPMTHLKVYCTWSTPCSERLPSAQLAHVAVTQPEVLVEWEMFRSMMRELARSSTNAPPLLSSRAPATLWVPVKSRLWGKALGSESGRAKATGSDSPSPSRRGHFSHTKSFQFGICTRTEARGSAFPRALDPCVLPG